MVAIRRSALIAIALLATAAPAVAKELVLSGNDGHLRIANPAATAVVLKTALVIERQDGRVWVVVPTKVFAIRSCAVPVTPTTAIAAHSVLDIARWSGLSCSAQCELACRANFPLGDGPFRFRVRPVHGASVTGPAFMMNGQSFRHSSSH